MKQPLRSRLWRILTRFASPRRRRIWELERQLALMHDAAMDVLMEFEAYRGPDITEQFRRAATSCKRHIEAAFGIEELNRMDASIRALRELYGWEKPPWGGTIADRIPYPGDRWRK